MAVGSAGRHVQQCGRALALGVSLVGNARRAWMDWPCNGACYHQHDTALGPEGQPRFGFGKFHLYLRLGWKMKPFFDAGPYGASAGIFTGISVRSDDWDDFPQQKEN